MKPNIETTRTLKPDLKVEPEKTDDEPIIEVEFPEVPDTWERPSLEHRKAEASKPLYLARYE